MYAKPEHGSVCQAGAWQCMPCCLRITNEMFPETYTMDKVDFLKPVIHSQIIEFSAIYVLHPQFCLEVSFLLIFNLQLLTQIGTLLLLTLSWRN